MFDFLKKKDTTNELKVCLKHENAVLPTAGHKTDAGLDLYLTGSLVLKPKQGRTFPIGISVCIPEGYVGLILPRSSVSFKGVHVCTGVVDAGYVGEISISVNNMTNNLIKFKPHDRIAQLVIIPVASFTPIPTLQEDLDLTAAEFSNRGNGAFGSTGE